MLRLPHGEVRTPAFVPLATKGTVRGLLPAEVADLGYDMVLGNTYHLFIEPGHERIAAAGGLHEFMRWDKPILTDSGGYQVMSLSALTKQSEEGVAFKSHLDGSRHMLTPERSMEIQRLLGSDIVMAFDECPPNGVDAIRAEASMERSMRWAARSRAGCPAAAGDASSCTCRSPCCSRAHQHSRAAQSPRTGQRAASRTAASPHFGGSPGGCR